MIDNKHMDLLKNQEQLKKEAESILDDLQLITLLSSVGDPKITGSMTLSLMVWPDIDIDVFVMQYPHRDRIIQLLEKLSHNSNMFEFRITDNTKKIVSHYPQGFLLQMKAFINEKVWQFDIWFIQRVDRDETFTEQIQKNLTDEKRTFILHIKESVSKLPQYNKTVFSINIYKAVIEDNIKNVEEFKNYMQEKGIHL